MPHYGNDVPFEVPYNWTWCKIKDIGSVVTGNTPSKDNADYYGGNIPFFKPTDLEQGRDTKYASDYLSALGFEQSRKLPAKTILVTCIGATIGKTGIISAVGSCNQQINAVIPNHGTFYLFVYYVCISNYMQCKIKKNASATTLPILNKGNFENLLFPLPPLAEQQRIVTEIERWFALIDRIEQDKSDLQTVIKQTKSKILYLAIHGKLVPQDPADEPAIELLKRINPAFKPCDNAHYENLPSGWAAVTISEVFEINPKIQASDDSDAGFVPMANISDGFHNEFSYEVRKWGDIKNGFTRFSNGDIAVAKISPCLENRKSVIMRDLPNGIGAGTTELNIFRSTVVIPEYGLFFFKSDYFIKACSGSYNGVVGQQRVSRSLIENMEFLVPPVSEQKRIVATVNKYFVVIDRIVHSLQ